MKPFDIAALTILDSLLRSRGIHESKLSSMMGHVAQYHQDQAVASIRRITSTIDDIIALIITRENTND